MSQDGEVSRSELNSDTIFTTNFTGLMLPCFTMTRVLVVEDSNREIVQAVLK